VRCFVTHAVTAPRAVRAVRAVCAVRFFVTPDFRDMRAEDNQRVHHNILCTPSPGGAKTLGTCLHNSNLPDVKVTDAP